jgi:uncharacterized protein YjiS (DUF1127 family)
MMAQLLHGFGDSASPASLSELTSGRTLVRRLADWFAERRLRAVTMRELSLLNPRDLADLSIAPSDFDAIARGNWKR